MLVKGEPKPESSKIDKQHFLTPTQIQALFDLLIHPEWLQDSFRQLEQKLGIAKSTISNLFAILENKDFLDRQKGKTSWNNLPALQDFWIQSYGARLRPKLSLGCFRFSHKTQSDDWKSWKMTTHTHWGGEAAAELLTNELIPGEWTLYTEEAILDLQMRYRIVPDSEGPILIYKKFWKSSRHQTIPPSSSVPPFLVYADLILSKKARTIQLAPSILKQHVDHRFQ